MTSEEKLTMAITPKVLEDFYNQKIAPYLSGSGATHYSTEEKVVGTWIDSKPIYQKTLVGTTPSSANSSNYLAIGSSVNIGFIVSSFLYDGEGNLMPISPMTRTANGDTIIRCTLMSNIQSSYPNTVQVRNLTTVASWLNLPVYITIQYTKTTDA